MVGKQTLGVQISKTQKKVKVTEVNNDKPTPVPAARKKGTM
jgi:hypothetical protein